MAKELNELELAIIKEISRFNMRNAFLKEHLPYLKVKSREETGVGMYVNFEYISMDSSIVKSNKDMVLSSNKMLEIDGLKYGLNYELNIIKGKIVFLELVTNGELWDGKFRHFKFID